MTQALLQYRISFAGMSAFNYTHIQIKGKGIILQELDRYEAQDLIQEQNLVDAPIDEYDYHYGKIYTDGNFKQYVNGHPRVKAALLYLIEQLDK